jgi:hypothetical protein
MTMKITPDQSSDGWNVQTSGQEFLAGLEAALMQERKP